MRLWSGESNLHHNVTQVPAIQVYKPSCSWKGVSINSEKNPSNPTVAEPIFEKLESSLVCKITNFNLWNFTVSML